MRTLIWLVIGMLVIAANPVSAESKYGFRVGDRPGKFLFTYECSQNNKSRKDLLCEIEHGDPVFTIPKGFDIDDPHTKYALYTLIQRYGELGGKDFDIIAYHAWGESAVAGCSYNSKRGSFGCAVCEKPYSSCQVK